MSQLSPKSRNKSLTKAIAGSSRERPPKGKGQSPCTGCSRSSPRSPPLPFFWQSQP